MCTCKFNEINLDGDNGQLDEGSVRIHYTVTYGCFSVGEKSGNGRGKWSKAFIDGNII